MKKQIILLLTVVVISLITFTSCEPFIENKITIKNDSDASVTLHIRAELYEVQSGEQLVLNDFKKGTFEYETLYGLPDYAVTGNIEGDYAGELVLNAGTEALIYYTYNNENGDYTVFASLTTTDDVNRVDPFVDDETP